MTYASVSAALLLVALAFYVIASALFPAYVLLHRYRLGRGGVHSLGVAAVLHLAAIVVRGVGVGQAPFGHPVAALSFFAMALSLGFALVASRMRLQAAGAALAPFAFLMGVCSFVNLGKGAASTELTSGWLLVHVPIILLAYVSFTLAFAGSVLYLVHDQLLKRRLLRRLSNTLPPLVTTDKWVYRFIVFGFPLFTLGLATGVLWFVSTQQTLLKHGDPKVLLSGATWALYALYLYLRVKHHWRGRRANWLICAGFLAVVLTFFGVRHNLQS